MDMSSGDGELLVFSEADRARVWDRLVASARADSRLTAAAAVGSSATGGDRWSDIDLTFGVATGFTVASVLADWTDMLGADLGAVFLFDLPVEATVYRVFLLPGALQVDLSFAPAAEFFARGPRFRLLFGAAEERFRDVSPSVEETFGYGVHHLLRANVCIERERFWQAEYWLHQARDAALMIACHRCGLATNDGRGFDQLPVETRIAWSSALPCALTPDELRRALSLTTTGILAEAAGIVASEPRLRPILSGFARTTNAG